MSRTNVVVLGVPPLEVTFPRMTERIAFNHPAMDHGVRTDSTKFPPGVRVCRSVGGWILVSA